MEFHRHQEWLKFRRLIDRLALASNQFRLIVDSYATHGHAVTQRWAARRRCVHFHFTPTSSGCLNMVDRRFRDATENQLWRGVFTSDEDTPSNTSSGSSNSAPNPLAQIFVSPALRRRW
jgi:hypothetical protein